MKDHRFIELLNLYIDRQISAEETAELEAEIQSNPKRQAVYRRYCQIHTATKLVYESFRAGATEQPQVASGKPGTLELFENRRRRTTWGYAAAGFAAAACLAVVLIRDGFDPAGSADHFAAGSLQSPAIVQEPVAARPQAPVAEVEISRQPAANLVSLRHANSPDYAAMLTALREQDEERAVAAGRWQSKPVSLFDDNVFDANRGVNFPSSRPQPRHQPAAATQQTEFTAFQFQR